MIKEKIKILIVEDNDFLLKSILLKLERKNYKLKSVNNVEDALEWIRENKESLLLLDYQLENTTSLELINKCSKENIPFIIITGHGNEKLAVEMMKKGALNYIIKGSNFLNNLSLSVDKAIQEIKNKQRLKEAESKSAENEERFRAAFENANVGVCIVSIDGHLLKANDIICQIFGYSREELAKMSFNDNVYPDDREIGTKFIKDAIAGKIEKINFDKRYIHKKGHIIWGHVSSTLVRNAQGEPIYFISHVQDITERKKAESDLLESEKKFRDFVETTKEWIWMIDIEAKHTYCNPAIKSILGYDPEKLIGVSSFKIMHPDDLAQVKEMVEKKNRRKRRMV